MTKKTDSGQAAGGEPGRALALHAALAEIVAQFKVAHPIVWERIRLGPTHHGIDQMIDTLRG